ncbi:MAG: PAS domain-containing protein, partial [Usitatibacter sp.]
MERPLAHSDIEARLAALTPGFDHLALPVTILDTALRYRYMNAAYSEHAGRPPSEFLGRTPDEAFDKIPTDTRRSQLHRALDGETVIFNRQTIEGPNAGKWVRAHYMPLRDEGCVYAVLAVLVDVQQLKDTEVALARQQMQTQMVLDNIGVPMSYIDRDWRFQFANQPGLDWRIGDASRAIGKHVEEIFSPEIMEVVRPELVAAFKGEKRSYERLATLDDGTSRWVRVHLVPDLASDGSVQGLYSLMLDVDRDHRMREAMQQKESELREFAENIPGPIAMVDASNRYVFANKHFERGRGHAPGEIIGRDIIEVLGDEVSEKYYYPFIDRLKAGESCTYERLVGSPGEERWYMVRLAPIFDSDGKYAGFYIVGSDIHDIKLAQQQLAAQEAQLRLYTDNIPDSVAYLDRERRILFANRHFAQQRGTTPEAIIGLTSSQLMGKDTADWIRERTSKVFEKGETATYERVMKMPDGTERNLHVKAVPDFDETGKVRGMYVVAHDITEVKQAQEQLADREQDLRFFAENIPEAIVYVDVERGCTFVNNIFLATRGFTREFTLGKFPHDVYPPEVMEELGPHLERALAGHESTYERQLTLPGGTQRWVRVRITPRLDEDHCVMGYYVVSTDIHDIKSAQAAIEDKERQLRQVIDSIPTPMCFVDANMRYRYANDAFMEYIGQSAEKVIGSTVRDLLGEERWSQGAAYVERVMAGESLSFERPVHFANGKQRWMTVRLSPRFTDGKYVGYYATSSDIHEQKTVEEELRRTNTILSAHFDNTPLAVMEWDT